MTAKNDPPAVASASRPPTWWARRSLRARLTAAATLVTFAAVAGAAGVLVLRLHASLLANLDTAVTQAVTTAAAGVQPGPLSHPLPASKNGSAIVQIIAANGRILTSSANIDGDDRLFNFRGDVNQPTLTTVVNVPVGDDHPTYRAGALITDTPSGSVTVYAALPATEVDQSITELTTALAVGVPMVVVTLAVVGWMLVGLALRPVERLRGQAATISGTDLHRRLDPPPADDNCADWPTP